MKSIISKILITGTIVAAFTLNLQASPIQMKSDTGKMKKMDKMKMAPKKMKKDTGKMGKMSKM